MVDVLGADSVVNYSPQLRQVSSVKPDSYPHFEQIIFLESEAVINTGVFFNDSIFLNSLSAPSFKNFSVTKLLFLPENDTYPIKDITIKTAFTKKILPNVMVYRKLK